MIKISDLVRLGATAVEDDIGEMPDAEVSAGSLLSRRCDYFLDLRVVVPLECFKRS